MTDLDRDGLRALLEQNYDFGVRVALRIMKNEDDARDAVQDACLKVCKMDGFAMQHSFQTWFYCLVRSACVDIFRRRRNWGSSETVEDEDGSKADYLDTLPSKELSPLQVLWNLELAESIARAEEKLFPREKQAWDTRDLSEREAAVVLGMAEGTVKTTRFRARRRLEHELKVYRTAA